VPVVVSGLLKTLLTFYSNGIWAATCHFVIEFLLRKLFIAKCNFQWSKSSTNILSWQCKQFPFDTLLDLTIILIKYVTKKGNRKPGNVKHYVLLYNFKMTPYILNVKYFSFGYCVVCSSSIYGFWLPHWYLQTLIKVNFRKSLCRSNF
jgi:hypothetical protein